MKIRYWLPDELWQNLILLPLVSPDPPRARHLSSLAGLRTPVPSLIRPRAGKIPIPGYTRVEPLELGDHPDSARQRGGPRAPSEVQPQAKLGANSLSVIYP